MGYKNDFPQMVRETGFKLRQYRDGPLDWRLMGSYETDRILKEQNLEMVDKALSHLSEAPLGTVLETHILDSGIAKYFVMSQYAIQYLLCCRTYLDESVTDLREANTTAQQEIANLRKSLSDSSHEVLQLHKKITQIEAIREVVYPCHLCPKNFISNEALNIHIGRKHRVGTPPSTAAGGGGVLLKDKDNDVQLINTIKMELEIKQLKERLNAAERNIKERSSKRSSSSQQEQRDVGIQSNLAEQKEKDDVSSEALDSDASERKEQLHGLAERLSHFETWQMQLKQSNEQFIQDINQKLEGLSHALEQSKQPSPTTPPLEERVTTPCLEDLERILTEKVTEIGKASAHKLEEVVFHLEMSYKDKLEALERELKQLSVRKPQAEAPVAPLITPPASKIPKAIQRKEETSMERIRKQVESEFEPNKRDDDTYSIEEPHKLVVTQVQVQRPGQIPEPSSGAKVTEVVTDPAKLETREATDISESLSLEEDEEQEQDQEALDSLSEEGSELLTSEPEGPAQALQPPVLRPALKVRTPARPLTRRDARKLVNRKLLPHGFDLKTKHITQTSMKRINVELSEQRHKLKLQYPHFYATRNRIRKFVEKLCSAKLPQQAEVLLKHKTPLQPIEVPKRGPNLRRSVTTEEEEEEDDQEPELEGEEEEDEDEEYEGATASSRSSSPQKPITRDFKAHLEQILVKPAERNSKSSSMSARPVPLPRKRVMFNTQDSEE